MLSDDQQRCYDAVAQGKNLFITARAGAGKSFLINYIIENIKKQVLLCASTGISATLIGGRTLHSQFLINPDQNPMESAMSILASEKRLRKILYSKILIIDEISMVSDKLLNCVDKILQIVRSNKKPFGGLQVIFCGDFLQLPPVFKDTNCDGTYCIYSDAWQNANIENFLLTTNHRQDSDTKFYDLLTKIRYNMADNEVVSILKGREKNPDEKAIRLYSTNNEAAIYNNKMFSKLDKSTTHKYDMYISGDSGVVNNFLKNSLFEEHLELRLNARVMLLINKEVGKKYFCNGSLGTVVGFKKDKPIVCFDGLGELAIDTHIIQQYERITGEDGLTRNGEELLYMEQIPLKLAYAITIHKSQGQTFTSAVVDCSRIFTCGQVYVALSRIKSLDGLFIKGFTINKSRCDPTMVEWYKELEEKSKDEEK